MPGAGTHTTIIQWLAEKFRDEEFGRALGDPTANCDWSSYETDEGLQARYAVLGAMGPDIFYAMLDYGGDIQQFEDFIVAAIASFESVGHVMGEISNYVDGSLDEITNGVWDELQQTFSSVMGILENTILDAVVSNVDLWTVFMPLRQVDDYRKNWFWADYLHYVKTGGFARKLLDKCREYQASAALEDTRTTKFCTAYALGYLTHYVADTVGHAYVNRIVESPWRNCWQRHHLVENFIDAHIWESFHDGGDEPAEPSTDEQGLDRIIVDPSTKTSPAPYHYSRLNDLSNVGSLGLDPLLDEVISNVANLIQQGIFQLGVTDIPKINAPDDPAFVTWTEFMADALVQTYRPDQVHPMKLSESQTGFPTRDPDGYPSPEDIAGAYGAYRMLLSLATEDDLDAPKPPDIVGDLTSLLKSIWAQISSDLSSFPPPPTLPGSSGFSLSAMLSSIVALVKWLGQVADALLNLVGDLIRAGLEAGVLVFTEQVKVILWLLNTALFSIYQHVRTPLVMLAYSVPYTEDLTGTFGTMPLRSLWTTDGADVVEEYPFEPVVSQRDMRHDSSHPHTPYAPFMRPSDLHPAKIEFPPTQFPDGMLSWEMPEQMLLTEGAGAMFSADGPAPPTTVPLSEEINRAPLADVETFDGTQRFFGGIFDNCEEALRAAFDYITSGKFPTDFELPDYNLDSDRGYAWPCWDVDWNAGPPGGPPFDWNGCDPWPADTQSRSNMGPHPPRPGENGASPFGGLREGQAFINAAAISDPAGNDFFDFAFPTIAVAPAVPDIDACTSTWQAGQPPGPDYLTASSGSLLSGTPDDLVIGDPVAGPFEDDGRLTDLLRLQARTSPLEVLATATVLSMGVATTTQWTLAAGASSQEFATALAQLAVTGRSMFSAFVGAPPQEADVVQAVAQFYGGLGLDATAVQAHASDVLDTAYKTLWAIRSNDPGWRAFRSSLGWIAVSGFDDTPHRPVNVPTAPYPQFDLGVSVPILGTDDPTGEHGGISLTTRYMVASAAAFVGPNDGTSTFTIPDGGTLLAAPAPATTVGAPWPRTVPEDAPTIPPGDKIVVYVHGGGSRAEEAVALANWLILEGAAAGVGYTVISFDLPNSAYASTFDLSALTAGSISAYQPGDLRVLSFEQQFVINFIDALDATLGDVADRIVAVMGGSLGGNMSLLLTGQASTPAPRRPYLDTMVAWSATATAPAKYLGFLDSGALAWYVGGRKSQISSPELSIDHRTESSYIRDLYFAPLLGGTPGVTPTLPPDPVMWYRAGDPDSTGQPDWLPCKEQLITASRFDRYEIYSPSMRRWTTAVDLEQIWFSFQDEQRPEAITWSPTSHLLLLAGDWDNFDPNAIFNSTIETVRGIRRPTTGPPPNGKAEFWRDTGHSFHDERPHQLAKEIVYFLTNLDAGDSPQGTVVSTPQHAAYTETSE